GLRDTQLQERMAGGAQDRGLAFQAAESALREAEVAIADGDVNSPGYDNGLHYRDYTDDEPDSGEEPEDLPRVVSGNPVTEMEYGRDHYDWTGNSGNNAAVANASLNGLAQQPLYVIERLPENYSLIPESRNVTADPDDPLIIDYLITARGTGSTLDAVVILQSHYRKVID